MPFHRLALALVCVITAAAVTVYIGASLLSGTGLTTIIGLSILSVIALCAYIGVRAISAKPR